MDELNLELDSLIFDSDMIVTESVLFDLILDDNIAMESFSDKMAKVKGAFRRIGDIIRQLWNRFITWVKGIISKIRGKKKDANNSPVQSEEINRLKEEIKSKEALIERHKKEIEELREEKHTLRDEKFKLAVDNTNKDIDSHKLKVENVILKSDLDSSKIDYKYEVMKNERLKNNVEFEKRRRELAEEVIAKKEAQIKKLEEEANARYERYEELQKKYNDIRKNCRPKGMKNIDADEMNDEIYESLCNVIHAINSVTMNIFKGKNWDLVDDAEHKNLNEKYIPQVNENYDKLKQIIDEYNSDVLSNGEYAAYYSTQIWDKSLASLKRLVDRCSKGKDALIKASEEIAKRCDSQNTNGPEVYALQKSLTELTQILSKSLSLVMSYYGSIVAHSPYK